MYDAVLGGWGRYPVKPCRVTDLSGPLNSLEAFRDFTSLTPRGQGRSYGDAAQSAGPDGLVLDTRGQNHFLELNLEQGLLRAEAGVTLEEILDVIIPRGWFLPVLPGTRFVSLGGAVGSNIHGKNHHHTGGFANFVEALEVLTERGLLVCTPRENTDLFFATLGGFGLTGLVQSITLRLKRIETSLIAARLTRSANLEESMALCRELDDYFEYSVVWLDTLSTGRHLGRGIVMAGNHLPLAFHRIGRPLLRNRWRSGLTFPEGVPAGWLNPFSASLFNAAYYRRNLRRESFKLIDFESWFFPLDAVRHWNRMYGRRGFVQYQCVLPTEQAHRGLRRILGYLGEKRVFSFLSVLKRVREDTVYLPFAVPGFTLALDIPLGHDGVLDALEELDRMVLDHGGRLYLAKDARMKAATFHAMYPSCERWQEVRRRFSPGRRFHSALAERLEL